MILVTGGAGYIGSHIVKKLSESGEQVIVFDNLSAGHQSALLHGEKLIIGDITDQTAISQVLATPNIDLVIHCAALVNAAESVEKSEEYIKVNDLGSRIFWQEAVKAGIKHYIYASSAAVYGTPLDTSPIKESAPLSPTNPYGRAKLAGENSLKELVAEHGNYAIFRFFNVAGAESAGRLHQSKGSRAIMQRLFAVAAGEDKKLILSGNDYGTPDGTVIRDFIHVEDLVQSITLAIFYLRANQPSFTANLGTGIPTSMLNLHRLAEKITEKSIPLEFAPRNPGDISYSLADISLAKKVLNWAPAKTVEDMLRTGWNAYVKV